MNWWKIGAVAHIIVAIVNSYYERDDSAHFGFLIGFLFVVIAKIEELKK